MLLRIILSVYIETVHIIICVKKTLFKKKTTFLVVSPHRIRIAQQQTRQKRFFTLLLFVQQTQ